MPASLVSYSKILEIVGDILRVEVPADATQTDGAPRFNYLAVVQNHDGTSSLAQVIALKQDSVSLQVFRGTKGVATD